MASILLTDLDITTEEVASGTTLSASSYLTLDGAGADATSVGLQLSFYDASQNLIMAVEVEDTSTDKVTLVAGAGETFVSISSVYIPFAGLSTKTAFQQYNPNKLVKVPADFSVPPTTGTAPAVSVQLGIVFSGSPTGNITMRRTMFNRSAIVAPYSKQGDTGGGTSDADTLDGLDSTAFELTGDQTSTIFTGDLDTLSGVGDAGYYAWNSIAPTSTIEPSLPFSTFKVMIVTWDGAQAQQMVWGGTSGLEGMWIRRRDSGIWNTFKEVSMSTHDHDADYLGIAATAADSQLLDGLDSTAFAQKAVTETITNPWTFSLDTTFNSDVDVSGQITGELGLIFSTNATLLTLSRDTTTSNVNMQFNHPSATTFFGIDSTGILKTGSTSDLNSSGDEIYHEGNFVVGTDYQAAGSYAALAGNIAQDFSIKKLSLGNTAQTLLSGSTFGSEIQGTSNAHVSLRLLNNDDNDSFAVIADSTGLASTTSDFVALRVRANGNVDIGGDLTVTGTSDADTLDGLDSTSFLRSDADDNKTGNTNFWGTDITGTYTSAPVELREVNLVNTGETADAYAPALSFHWGGNRQAQLALHNDGVLHLRDGVIHDDYESMRALSYYCGETEVVDSASIIDWNNAFGWGDHAGLYVDLTTPQTIAGTKTFAANTTFSGTLGVLTDAIGNSTGTQLIISSGDSTSGAATADIATRGAQTAEKLYVNSEAGLEIRSSNNNWGGGTVYKTILGDNNGNSAFEGNITLSGTVDGRDVATDGTKLDGIEDSANAYTLNIGDGVTTKGMPSGEELRFTATDPIAVDNLDIGTGGSHITIEHADTDGNRHIPSGGSAGQYLENSVAGDAVWVTDLTLPTTSKLYLDGGVDSFIFYASSTIQVVVESEAELTVGVDQVTVSNLDVVGNLDITGTITSSNDVDGVWDFDNDVSADNGVNGRYLAVSGTTTYGSNIWTLDPTFAGLSAGNTWGPVTLSGLSWLRDANANANENVGEGLYIYQNGVLQAGLGDAGLYVSGDVRILGNITSSNSYNGDCTFNNDLVSTNILQVTGLFDVDTDIDLAPTNRLYFDGGVDTYVQEDTADNLRTVVGGTERLNINSSGAQVVGDITTTGSITPQSGEKYGKKTISTAAPTGGADGDVWYRYTA